MRRAVRKVLRLVAVCVAVLGFMQIGLEYVNHRVHPEAATNGWRLTLGLLAIGAGVFLFLASPSLAKQLTDDDDDDDSKPELPVDTPLN